MSVIQGNAIESGLAAYEIPNSLKFNSADSAYLDRTPTSAGSLTTWTYSVWVKRTAIGAGQRLFFAWQGTSGTIQTHVMFQSNDTILFEVYNDPTDYKLITTQVFRDPSSWYHIVAVYDSTNATSGDRMRLYVNGSRITAFGTAAYPSQNYQGLVNSTNVHNIGRRGDTGVEYFNGYMTEINHVDGQALDPTSFGEYNSETGVWQPIAYAGTYGTNGFYLPMTQDQIVEGFNTLLYRGSGSFQNVTGAGLSPDLVWIKNRSSAQSHCVIDTVRGATKILQTNETSAEVTISDFSFTSDGFTITDSNALRNTAGNNYVAWCWDAGNSTVSNTDGTITSSVRASQTYGFSVVTYTGTGSNATIGHGLGVAPKMVILKRRDSSSGGGSDWPTWHTALTGDQYLSLSGSGGYGTLSSVWNGSVPTSSVFSTGTAIPAGSYVAYCFAETGYSKFGSYSGTGTSGNTVTLGFKPAFVMIKRTDSAGDWNIRDNTRSPVNPVGDALYPNLSFAEYDGTETYINMTDTGFELVGNWASSNASGATYIYAAFKDQREAAFWRDFSGNGNHWQPNNLDFNDSVVDVPTNYGTDTGVGAEVRGNYATLNPLDQAGSLLFYDGNLKVTANTGWDGSRATMAYPSSGKWYWEATCNQRSTGATVGILGTSAVITGDLAASSLGYVYNSGDGNKYNNGSNSAYGATWTTGDVVGIAWDADAGTLSFYKNGTSQGTAWTGLTGTFSPAIGVNGSDSMTANFGQRPFAYTAPSGFKALCTQNLPEPTVVDGGEYFNTVLYTGNGSTQTVSGVGFQPDLVWIKNRQTTNAHKLVDAVRGAGISLSSNSTDAEGNESLYFTNFTSDGFDLALGGGGYNAAYNYVAWNWKAGGTGVSNTDGTITSTVSANTTAKFSIATGTTLASGTLSIGHGLGVSPAMVIYKSRDTAGQNWWVWHQSLPNAATGRALQLNTTSGEVNGAYYGTPAVSPTVVTMAAAALNSDRFVLYSFAPVEGYSAFGSYTGNGSSDGPFVYTGFRPRWILMKYSSTTSYWLVMDTVRNTYNVVNQGLRPNTSDADSTALFAIDILSNGFKPRDGGGLNGSGVTVIYAAFAENPFKYSLAR